MMYPVLGSIRGISILRACYVYVRIAFVCMPVTGHLNPMIALARKLQARGHEIVFVSFSDAKKVVHAAGLTFAALGEQAYPAGSMAPFMERFAQSHGLEPVQYWIAEFVPRLLKAALEELPRIAEFHAVDAFALDTTFNYIELVALRLHKPYIHVWSPLPFDSSGTTPPYMFDLPYDPSPAGRARNLEALGSIRVFSGPRQEIARAYAQSAGLEIDWTRPDATASELLILSQTPREFDLPGIPRPPQFRYTGPFHDDSGREPVSFAWEKLTGAPLIYTSFGTLANGLEHIHRTILDAARKLPEMQLVFSTGRNVSTEDIGPIPANVLAVQSAPQLELLKRAQLCITHAGLNTTLEALMCGVPMLAIPITFDQPGVALRIAHHGTGEVLRLHKLSSNEIATLARRILDTPAYRTRARHFQQIIEQTEGLELAANLVESSLREATMAKL
jgi:zeaxanthin glucosyltransferase